MHTPWYYDMLLQTWFIAGVIGLAVAICIGLTWLVWRTVRRDIVSIAKNVRRGRS